MTENTIGDQQHHSPSEPVGQIPEEQGSLRALAVKVLDEQARDSRPDPGAGSLLADSFKFEINRNLQGLAQVVGAEQYVPDVAQPEEAKDSLGQHVQMAGRAVAGLLPTLAMAAASRFGLGKLLGHEATGAESAIMRRTAIGLNTVESASTGFLVGSLLTPTDASARESWTSFLGDRMRSGVTSAAAFSVMSATSLGLNRFATSEFGAKTITGGLLKNSVLNGVISGVPGGIANVEFDSLARTGKLSDDSQLLGKSVYEMSLFGGTFGLGARIIESSAARKTPASVSDAPYPDVFQIGSSDGTTPKAQSVDYLKTIFGAESSTMAKLTAHDAAHSSYSPIDEIVDFIRQNPAERSALVKSQVENFELWDASSMKLGIHRLGGLERLQQQLGADSPLLGQILKREDGNYLSTSELANFIEKDPTNRISLIDRTIKAGGDAKALASYNLESNEKLEKHFGSDSPVVKRLNEFNSESALFSLVEVSRFVDKDPETRAPLISDMVKSERPVGNFYADRLEAYLTLKDTFGLDSPVMKNLLQSESAAPYGALHVLSNVAEFIRDNPERGPAIVKLTAIEGATLKDLSNDQLMTRLALSDVFKGNQTVVQSWLKGDGVYDEKLAGMLRFVQENPAVNSEILKRVVANSSDDFTKIDERYLRAVADVTEQLGPDSNSMNYLEHVGANMQQVSKYLSRNPGEGVSTIKAAVELGADSRQFNTSSLEGLRELLRLGEEFPAFRARLPGLITGDVDTYGLAGYMVRDYDTSDRMRRVLTVVDAGATGEQLKYLEVLDAIDMRVRLDHADMKKLLEANREGLDLQTLSQYLVLLPEKVKPILQEILGGDATNSDPAAPNPYLDLIRTMKAHEQSESANNRFINRVVDSVLTPEHAIELNQFISHDPQSRTALVGEAVERGGNLYVKSLQAAEDLSRRYGPGSETLAHIYEGEQYYGLSLPELRDFINADSRNTALVEASLKEGDYLSVPRLAGLQKLFDTFGKDSDTTKYFLDLERDHNYSIADLGKFLDEHPDQADHVKHSIESGVSWSQLVPARLSAVATLEKTFGLDSARLTSLLQTESEVPLTQLSDFVTGKSNFAFAGDLAARKRFLERELDGGNVIKADGLETTFQLEHLLGDHPAIQQLKHLDSSPLSALTQFIKSDPEKTLPFMRKLAEQTDELSFSSAISNTNQLSNLMQLDKFLASDKPMLQKIIDFDKQGVDIQALVRTMNLKPEPYVRLASIAIDEGNARHLKIPRLSAIAELEMALGRDSDAMKAVLKHEDSVDIGYLSKLIFESDRYRQLILDATKDGGDPTRLNAMRLIALRNLKDMYQDSPEVVEKLLKRETDSINYEIEAGARDGLDNLENRHSGYGLIDIAGFITTPERKELVEKLILDEKVQLKDFRADNLVVRDWLDVQKTDPALAGKILEFVRERNVARGIYHFLNFDGKTPREDRPREIAKLIDLKAPDEVFGSIDSFAKLDRALGSDDQTTKRLFELHDQGMKLNDLSSFVQRDEPSRDLVKKLLADGAPAKQFTLRALYSRMELQELTVAFPADEQQAIVHLYENGLSPSRLKNFIDENLTERLDLVKTMLKEKADVERFNQQMSLTVLPDNVARAVVNASANGGMSVAQILGNLRDWRSGRHFRQALIDQVQAGKSLTLQDAENLASQARQNWIQDGGSLWPKPLAELTVNTMPEVLNDSVDSILGSVPKDTPIVVLGRDMWSVLPKLRVARPDAQYFLWSSSQDKASAAAQWLKEVPPGAAVIDTGYAGSIINIIRGIDPTASGYLLSTNGGKYPRLMQSENHAGRVELIEMMPKLIGRSTQYTEQGGTIARSSAREGNDVQKNRTWPTQNDRWMYERSARQTFRAMGLPEWDSWRYSQFTGLTPGERLGLSSDAEIQAHYRRVQHERSSKTPDTKPQTQ